ncbi:MAG: class III signal peptide-containing protein, partial [Hadesarchaea archaeon]|nr:class III signal peptide-containing protein [Hadesarchaea archaeon]
MRLSKKGQGATEYLLMLAAVLVIVAIAVYYVTSTGGYPAVAVTAVKYGDDTIRINVDTGSIPA